MYGEGFFLQALGILVSRIGIKTSFPCKHELYLVPFRFVLNAVTGKRTRRQCAGSLGGKRAFPVQGIVHIDDPSFLMCSH